MSLRNSFEQIRPDLGKGNNDENQLNRFEFWATDLTSQKVTITSKTELLERQAIVRCRQIIQLFDSIRNRFGQIDLNLI